MELDFDFSLVQSQKLLLTPQLKQAIEILGMSSPELYNYVESQLESNPVIDINTTADEFKGNRLPEFSKDWLEAGSPADGNDIPEEEAEAYETPEDSADRLTIKEYLLVQLNSLNLSNDRHLIGEYLIDNIDENGYLKTGLTDAAAYFNKPVVQVLEVLELLQTFDPPGICSRNLKECLTIQLKQMGCEADDVYTIVEGYLDDLAANRYVRITRQTGLKRERLNEILEVIKSLEPKPGREFYKNAGLRVQVPDILLKQINGVFKPIINEDAYPDLNINDHYRRLSENETNPDARKYLQNKLNNALWLIKSIEQRKCILLRLAEHIVSANHDFFMNGGSRIRPGSLEKVSEGLNMHESILRKAVAGKFIQCSWGIYELSDFFI